MRPAWELAPSPHIRTAGGVRTRTVCPLMAVTLPKLVYGSVLRLVGTLGLAPSCRNGNRFTGGIGVSTVNVPLGWPAGLAPACSRFTASCLDYFGIDHSPPGRNRTFTFRLSGECTALVLQAGSSSTSSVGKIRRVKKPDSIQRLSHHTAARLSEEDRAKQAASESNAAARIWSPRSSPDGNPRTLVERVGSDWCVREDSNLRHRRSHCRVPIRGTNTWSG